jgi:hypothetical protein
VRYRLLTIASLLAFGATTWLFCVELTKLLDTGTCASGGPYVSARPCPEGTGTDALLLMVSILGFFVAVGIAGLRGRPSGGGGLGFGSLVMIGWAIFFTGSGAVSLIHALTSDVIGDDGKLGGIIVGATFLVMGVPVLLFAVPSAIRSALRGRDGRGPTGPVTYADNSGVHGWMSTMRLGSQVMRDMSDYASAGTFSSGAGSSGSSDDSIAKLERLQRLREQGALTAAEFEEQKQRILRGSG